MQIDFAAAADNAVRMMDNLSIIASIWMPPPQPPGHQNPILYSEFLDVIRDNPKRFLFLGGGGTLNPMIHEAAESGEVSKETLRKFDAIADEIAAAGARGFGEMTAFHFSFHHGHPFLAVQPDHPLFKRLADIAARHNMVIDLHMEAIAEDTVPLRRFSNPPNPSELKENISAFERLLAHNRKARIVWAHIGWDNTGHQTVSLLRRLLKAHRNLFLQVKIGLRPPRRFFRSPGGRNRPVDADLNLRPEWLALMKDFPNRFVFAADHFFGIPGKTRQIGRGGHENEIIGQLPEALARKIGYDNPVRIYRLK